MGMPAMVRWDIETSPSLTTTGHPLLKASLATTHSTLTNAKGSRICGACDLHYDSQLHATGGGGGNLRGERGSGGGARGSSSVGAVIDLT